MRCVARSGHEEREAVGNGTAMLTPAAVTTAQGQLSFCGGLDREGSLSRPVPLCGLFVPAAGSCQPVS